MLQDFLKTQHRLQLSTVRQENSSSPVLQITNKRVLCVAHTADTSSEHADFKSVLGQLLKRADTFVLVLAVI